MSGGPQPQRLTVVPNTPTRHNVLVCTLCSCYPIGLLGPSPSWYKSEAYRSRIVREPRAVLAEFGLRAAGGDGDRRARHQRGEPAHGAAEAPGRHRRLDETELAALVTRERPDRHRRPLAKLRERHFRAHLLRESAFAQSSAGLRGTA